MEEKRHRSGRQYYDVNGQLYLKLNNSGIKLNMNFNSETCGRCFKVGSLIENTRKIIGNSELFRIHSSILGTKKLMRQIYADGTTFYSLQDERGNWKVGYGNRNLIEVIGQIKREIETYSTSKEELRSGIYEKVIKEKKELLIKLMGHSQGY
ncbi:hypothetical protein JOD82_002182 [Paenibacillus sp. 1182]|uniref:hypothetical protein n=1 Tax=Paenibacillus sp. 1182 TaxID=2806565 RepID=UPI001AE75619|nr:hypothetical protein [Paenibacillus sp. 1182]MBP1309162.1 hypothetical protein [Paenibacillus sp. 1182]